MKSIKLALLASSIISFSSFAVADDTMLVEKVKELDAKVKKLEKSHTKVKDAAKPELYQIQPAEAKPVGEFKLAPAPRFTYGDSTFNIKGLIQSDFAWFDDDKRDQSDGSTIHNARLSFGGNIDKDWFYSMEANFAYDSAKITTAYLGYKFTPNTKISVGQIDEPMSLEENMSARWTTFLERASVNAMVPGMNIGAILENYGQYYTAALSLTENSTRSTLNASDSPFGATGRFVVMPYSDQGRVLHFDVSGSYRTTEHNSRSVRYSEKPESRIGLVEVDTGTISNVKNYKLAAVEFLGIYDAFSLQSEYLVSKLERRSGYSDPSFDSGYAQIAYTLTGEAREYDKTSGTAGKISPKNPFNLTNGGMGAWEVAARYNFINLKNRDINGGSMHNWGLALNWYASDYVKFGANYIFVNANSSGEPKVHDDPRAFMLRAQVAF